MAHDGSPNEDTLGSMNSDFYAGLVAISQFDQLADYPSYSRLPDEWLIGVADIISSTKEVENGRYKVVNTVGAAVISAQINGAKGEEFPYVFGGDGAAFAIWPQQKESSAKALGAVKKWAEDEFDIGLRTALIPVKDIRAAGFEVTVAKFEVAEGVYYAMFEGGGVSWAEQMMKQGQYSIDPAPPGVFPDLTGLSCRWTPMSSENGSIVSVVIAPKTDADESDVSNLMHQVVSLAERLKRSGHPVPVEGPGVSWPPEGLALEAHASHGRSSLFKRKLQLYLETLIAWLFFKTGMKAGAFDPAHYAQTTGRNADFRKFEDGLKMTLDCDETTRMQLESLLEEAQAAGIVRYGMFEQNEAIMTCIVPSITSDDHVHFIDGAAGGYTKAAAKIKAAISAKL